MTNAEFFGRLFERITHSGTMRPLTPLEQQWVEDYTAHREALSHEEREAFDKAETTAEWDD